MQLILVFLFTIVFASSVIGEVTEPATGHKFSPSLGFLSLAGVGVRVKQIGPISAKVYALGLYAPRGEVSKKCRAVKAKTAADVLQALNKAPLINDGAVVLKMARDVKAETMASALGDAVKPRMGGKDAASIEKLRKIIVEALPTGCAKNAELKFVCNGSGHVTVTINGKFRGDITSSALSRAFLATYCDSKGVSSSLRDDLSRNLFEWSK